PVGTCLNPAAVIRLMTSSGTAVVATSTSAIDTPNNALRTAPPTARASSPSQSSTPSSRGNPPPVSHGAAPSLRSVRPSCNDITSLRGPRDEFAIFNVRRHVSGPRRRAGKMGKVDEAAEHQGQRSDGQRRDPHQRPGVKIQYPSLGRPQKHRIE